MDDAQQDIESSDLQDAWNQIAPVTEHLDAQDAVPEDEWRTDGDAEHYDLAQDLRYAQGNENAANPLQKNNEMPDEEYRTLMRTLNTKQQQFIQSVLYSTKTSDDQQVLFLSGGAGVGKTHVSKLLYQTLLKFLNKSPGSDPDNPRVLLLAPTGKAAFILKGNTIHSELRIPVSQKLDSNKKLDSDILNTIRTQMRDVKFIFIDEVSMLGSELMNFVHNRLQEISGSSKDFGGYSILFIGDLFQLKPVCDSHIFRNGSHNYSPLATNLWNKNVVMYELTEIMRQIDQAPFANILNRLREGLHTDEDIQVLLSRIDHTPLSEIDTSINSLPHLFLDNARVSSHNTKVFVTSQPPKKEIHAIDTIAESMQPSLREAILSRIPNDPRKTMQLFTILQVAEGLQYELSFNINTRDGLTNGALCTVKKISTSSDNKARGVIWVLFQIPTVGQEKRSAFRRHYRAGISPEWTPITPEVKRILVSKNHHVTREQFPLRPAAARTIHRTQGSTEHGQIIIDFAGRTQPHIHYVALSRVQELSQLTLRNFNPKKIKVSPDVVAEMRRLRQTPYIYSHQFLHSTAATIKIMYINAQSLHRHLPDVAHDINMKSADVLICSETRLISSDSALLPPYQTFRNDAPYVPPNRPYHGMVVYHKPQSLQLLSVANSSNVEVITATLEHNSSTVQLIALYKPPPTSFRDLLAHLTFLLETDNASLPPTIILGDFNIDASACSSTTTVSNQLSQFMTSRGLLQVMNQFTTDARTTIDHIYTNIPHIITGVAETYFSYHKGIWIALP